MSDTLLELAAEIQDLESAQAVLNWDQGTHMPPEGGDRRARVLATLAREIHRKTLNPQLVEAAYQAMKSEDALIRDVGEGWLKAYDQATRVPEVLVGELAEASARGENAWREAETFEEVLPYLEDLVRLNRAYASCFPEMAPYDALIDQYDEGLTQAYIDRQFDVLRPGLLELRQRATAVTPPKHQTSCEEPGLLALCRTITEGLGYDYQRGNLATTEHPFECKMAVQDVRIATSTHTDDPLYTLMGAIHEAGHAMYDQGAGYESVGLDDPCSMALHESQSLFWEVMYGKSPEFWQRWLPELNRTISNPFPSVEAVIQELRRYDPSNVIRLKAGDLDYGLHIILRYDLERALFTDQIEARDMKDKFNELCVAYFGKIPSNDRREGVLQDVHWPSGAFGYFPSYLLGVSFAAQLWSKCETKEPQALLAFLRKAVHRHGGRYTFKGVTWRAGGYDPEPYLRYLQQAYGL